MKKFTKVCLSIAGIVAVLGIMCCCVSLAIGGSWEEVNEHMETTGIPEVVKDVIKENVSVSNQLSGGNETQTDTVKVDEITGIHMKADLADIEFVESKSTEDVKVTMKKGYTKHYSCKVNGSTLEIEYNKNRNNYKHGPKITIELPDGIELTAIEADTDLGDIKMENFTLNADKLDVHSSLGDVKLTDMTIPGKIYVSTSMGDVKLLDGSFGEMVLTNNMGDITITGEVTGDVEANCDMGDVKTELSGAETDYNYELETSMGDVEINGRNYDKNMSGKANISNPGAAITLTLNSSMGDVKVDTK